MGLGPWGRWAVGFDIITYKIIIFYFILFIFESMHLSERLQTFRKVHSGFLNRIQFLTKKNLLFVVLPGILTNSCIHFCERKKL